MATAATDVTVNLDGLWLLQAMLGVSRLAPELRGLPYGEPRSGEDWLARHPGVAVLAEQGICDDVGVVRADIAERMAVLAAPDVEVIILVSRGPIVWAPEVSLSEPSTWRTIPEDQLRIVLARRDGRWVSAARVAEHVTIDDCADWGQEWLGRLACGAVDMIHVTGPSRFTPVNVPLDEMNAAVAQRRRLGDALTRDAPLRALGLRGAALAEVAAALDKPIAEATLYARAYVDDSAVTSRSVLDVRDTPSGRLAMYRLVPPRGSREDWMIIGPATAAHIDHGVSTVLRSVPVRCWAGHERIA